MKKKKKKKEKTILNKIQETKIRAIRYFPAGIICGPHRDHLRFGIICGPIWGSFAVGDHLRRCTGPRFFRCKGPITVTSASLTLLVLCPEKRILSNFKTNFARIREHFVVYVRSIIRKPFVNLALSARIFCYLVSLLSLIVQQLSAV